MPGSDIKLTCSSREEDRQLGTRCYPVCLRVSRVRDDAGLNHHHHQPTPSWMFRSKTQWKFEAEILEKLRHALNSAPIRSRKAMSRSRGHLFPRSDESSEHALRRVIVHFFGRRNFPLYKCSGLERRRSHYIIICVNNNNR